MRLDLSGFFCFLSAALSMGSNVRVERLYQRISPFTKTFGWKLLYGKSSNLGGKCCYRFSLKGLNTTWE